MSTLGQRDPWWVDAGNGGGFGAPRTEPEVVFGRDRAEPGSQRSSLSSIERFFSRALELARHQLGMDIAWVSEFTEGYQVVRSVQGDMESFGVEPGFCLPYDESYCSRVVEGRLPNTIPDSLANEHTRGLAITAQLDIGSYVGIPVVLSDGKVYGMLCCLSHDPDESLGKKDVRFLGILAQAVAEEVERHQAELRRRTRQRSRIESALTGEGFHTLFQPIVSLSSLQVIGVEALTRFEGGPATPNLWFAEAAEVDLGVELELAAVRTALASLPDLPPKAYLGVNASPELVTSPALLDLLSAGVGHRVLLEVTEHALVEDYDSLLAALAKLREAGVRVAVDDAGAGYSGLQHILRLQPDVIKLDVALTRGIDDDLARQALASGLVGFARRLNATVVVEGVETAAELETLRRLGVTAAQGYFLARPRPLPLPSEIDGRALAPDQPT